MTGWTFDELDQASAWRLDRLRHFAAAKRRGVAQGQADQRAQQPTAGTSPQALTVVRRPVER